MALADYFSAFIAVICLICNISVQIMIYRCFPSIGLLKSVVLGFGAGIVILLLGDVKAPTVVIGVDLITYVFLGYCYFHFINLGETARRIRILRELSDSGVSLTLNEILARYNAREILENRISRLLKNGQIVLVNGEYYIGKSFLLRMARVLMFLKLILMRKKDESDSCPSKL